LARRRVSRRVDPAECYAGVDYYRLAEKIRSELTSGDPNVAKKLTDLLLSVILKDSTGAELSDYIKNLNIAKIAGITITPRDWSSDLAKLQNLDKALSALLTASGNVKIALVETTIKQPVDIQDRWQESVTIASSGARTADGNTSDIDIGRFLYGEFCLDVTAVSGTTPTLDVYIEAKDQLSGKYKVIWSQTGINAVGTFWSGVLTLPYKYVRARWVIGGTSPSFTFSIGLEAKS